MIAPSGTFKALEACDQTKSWKVLSLLGQGKNALQVEIRVGATCDAQHLPGGHRCDDDRAHYVVLPHANPRLAAPKEIELHGSVGVANVDCQRSLVRVHVSQLRRPAARSTEQLHPHQLKAEPLQVGCPDTHVQSGPQQCVARLEFGQRLTPDETALQLSIPCGLGLRHDRIFALSLPSGDDLVEPLTPGVSTGERKPPGTPSQLIPFALEAEQICQDRRWVGPNEAFCAGLHYDWLAAINKKRGGAPEDKSALNTAFKEGVLTAKVAYEIGQGLQELRLGKHLFPAGLLLPIGKVIMACAFPARGAGTTWPKFLAEGEQAGDRKIDYLQFMENRRFPITHSELSSLVVNFGALLRDIEKALYFYPEAYRLKRSDPDGYQLSVLLSVATRLVRAGKNLPVLDPFHREWMETHQLTDDKLGAALRAAQR